ncbi:MAG: hypothetical protein L6V88_07820 [Anaerotruncus sp.]|nr:MAG: hypothetical protein L6V88_07820 [Anaerotruncus sp.]
MVIQSMDAIGKSGRFDLLPSVCAHLTAGEDPENEAIKFNAENSKSLMAESVNNEKPKRHAVCCRSFRKCARQQRLCYSAL